MKYIKIIYIVKDQKTGALVPISKLPVSSPASEVLMSNNKGQLQAMKVAPKNPAAVALGAKGGKQRAKNLSPKRRSEIASIASGTRWNKPQPAKALKNLDDLTTRFSHLNPIHPLTGDEAAEMIGVSPKTLANWRSENKGPCFVRIGHSLVRYLPGDVVEWIKRQIVTSSK